VILELPRGYLIGQRPPRQEAPSEEEEEKIHGQILKYKSGSRNVPCAGQRCLYDRKAFECLKVPIDRPDQSSKGKFSTNEIYSKISE
jgi:hypothetical protein